MVARSSHLGPCHASSQMAPVFSSSAGNSITVFTGSLGFGTGEEKGRTSFGSFLISSLCLMDSTTGAQAAQSSAGLTCPETMTQRLSGR